MTMHFNIGIKRTSLRHTLPNFSKFQQIDIVSIPIITVVLALFDGSVCRCTCVLSAVWCIVHCILYCPFTQGIGDLLPDGFSM